MTWRPVTDCRQHRTFETLLNAFRQGLSPKFFEAYQASLDIFGILPRFLANLPECENLVCNATARTKTALVIVQL